MDLCLDSNRPFARSFLGGRDHVRGPGAADHLVPSRHLAGLGQHFQQERPDRLQADQGAEEHEGKGAEVRSYPAGNGLGFDIAEILACKRERRGDGLEQHSRSRSVLVRPQSYQMDSRGTFGLTTISMRLGLLTFDWQVGGHFFTK